MDINEKNMQKLTRLLSLMDEDSLTKEDFLKAFQNVVELVKKMQSKNQEEFALIQENFKLMSEKMRGDNVSSVSELKSQANDFVSGEIRRMRMELDAKLTAIDEKMASVQDGEDGETIIGPAGKDGSPDTPEQVRDKLEKLSGDERIDASAIKGLEKGANITDKRISLIGGGRGVYLYVDGVKKGNIKTLNLIPGTGVALTYALSYGRNDITISSSSTALGILTATGTVNGSNAAFTFVSKPNFVISDGASYRENKGWTWTGATLTVTMDIAPSYDIYALG
jgi:hypothetical protein